MLDVSGATYLSQVQSPSDCVRVTVLASFHMRLTHHLRHAGRAPVVLCALLLALSPLPAFSQSFKFFTVSSSLPWSPRNNPGALLIPLSETSLLFFGGSNGRTDNDVWLSSNSGVDWGIQSGGSVTGDAPGAAANASFPPTAYGMMAYDSTTGLSFQYSGFNVTGPDNNVTYNLDTYYSTDGVNWAQATIAAGAPAPQYRIWGSIVTTSYTHRDGSFLLVGGFDGSTTPNFTASALVWKSSAVSGKPDVREWTVVGSTLSAAGGGFLHLSTVSAVLIDRGRLDGKDILYALGGVDFGSQPGLSDAVWASSDEGATWVQLTTASFGQRLQYAAAVTDSGILFVLGGQTSDRHPTLQTDMWASFDGGYTWSVCTNSLPPRTSAVMAYNSYTQQLMYGMGFNATANGPMSLNDLYSADVSGPDTVAAMCGTSVPAAGVGLTLWPAVAGSSSTGMAGSSSSSSSSVIPPTAASSSSSTGGAGSSSSGTSSATSSGGPLTSTIAPVGGSSSSSGSVIMPPSSTGSVQPCSSSSSSSSSSSASADNGSGSGSASASSSSSHTGLLTTFTILFAALTVACAVLAYSQYRLRVYGSVCCEWCAGVTCGQLCGETLGWGTKWTRRGNMSDADLLRQVATDRYD